mmetsp:Transcript_8821/g.25656  ORF Transcript_8821/g.25656 Transcript_8821/m.25656 type:complete len:228 (-) Transcript_8821:324-1007(-)
MCEPAFHWLARSAATKSLFSTQLSCGTPRSRRAALSSFAERARASSSVYTLRAPRGAPGGGSGLGPASADELAPLARSHASPAAAASSAASKSKSPSAPPLAPPAPPSPPPKAPDCIISFMAARMPAARISGGTAARKASPSALMARARRRRVGRSTAVSWSTFLHTCRSVFSMSSTDISHMSSRKSAIVRAPRVSRRRSRSRMALASSSSRAIGSSAPVMVTVRAE